MGVACDKECVENVQHTIDRTGIISDGGVMDIDEKAHFKRVCDMSCDERALTNLFCLFDSMNLGHEVCMDDNEENAFFVEKDNEVGIF